MKIKILGWKSRGFRSPNATVDLTQGDVAHDICFIQMPNGTGKTTTLKLLKAVLSGSASNWSKNDIYQIRKKDFIVNHGEFITYLQIDDDKLTIELNVDFQNAEVSYRTSSNLIGGIRNGWSPPNQLIRFLNDEFVKLFIFDGELANKLLDDDFEEASKAIDSLFQLYYLNDIKLLLDDYWKISTKDVSKKSSRSVNKKESELVKLEEHLVSQKKKYKATKKRIESNNTDISKLSTKIDEKIKKVKKYRKDYEEMISELDQIKSDISSQSQIGIGLLRNPANIHSNIRIDLVGIKHSLDDLRLPANTSKQFFLELSKREFCICGNPIHEKEKINIKKQAKSFLSTEISGFLNALKSEIETLENDDFVKDELDESIEELKNLLDKRDKLESKKRYISQQLQDSGDVELKKMEADKVLKSDENKKLKKIIEKYEGDDRGDPLKSSSIEYINKRIEDLKNEISTISGTVTLKNKIDVFQKILADTYLRTKEELKIKILNKFRKRVDEIFKYNPIKIESIEGSIQLGNRQEGASAGQTLGIAYSYLTTLLQWGTHSFPLVVDSPAGPLDYTVRREIAGIIPQLTDQFIAFTISSERSNFVDVIKHKSDQKIESLTLLRKTDATKELVHKLKPNIISDTKDGFVIEDEEFFKTFDLDEEV